MKTSRKISFVLLAAMLSIGFANAQLGIQAGYSNSKDANSDAALNGFHAGLFYNLPIQGAVSLQYGLLYNYLTTNNDYWGIANSSTTAHRLDLPVRVAVEFPLGGTVSAFVFGGPNFNYALYQATKLESTLGSVETNSIYKLEMTDGKKLYTPFDLQLGAGAGLKFNQLSVRFSYDWGMLDRNNSDAIWKNNDMKVGIAYHF